MINESWPTCASHLTSNCVAPGDDFPQHQSHGVNIGLFERLDVLQVDSGLQDLGGHVPGRTHLGEDGAENKIAVLSHRK